MRLEGSTALVTGANRGLGRHLARELTARGATVYAGARDPGRIDLPGVIPVALDITDPDSIAAAASVTGDVRLLVNNAGSSTGADLLTGPGVGAYCAAKSAEWAMSNAVRLDLATRGVDGPKSDPADVAALALDGVAAGRHEVLADDLSNRVRSGLAGGVAALYPGLTRT